MKKHFHNPPPSAESMTFLTFSQMATCVAAFAALFIVAVVVRSRTFKEKGKQLMDLVVLETLLQSLKSGPTSRADVCVQPFAAGPAMAVEASRFVTVGKTHSRLSTQIWVRAHQRRIP